MTGDVELERIERFLRRDPALHAYEIGDLDPFFALRCRWFAAPEEGELHASALLYTGSDPPTLLCFAARDPGPAEALLRAASSGWPDRLYAHLSPGLAEALPHRVEARTPSVKMALGEPRLGEPVPVALLGPTDEAELRGFYARSYPGSWFDPRMLAAEPYVGIREGHADGDLVAVAGLHVWSEALGVAALGNVAVDPRARGRGLGRAVTAALCRRIVGRVATVALNVHADNVAARATYRRLGFVDVAAYDELVLAR